MTTTQLERAQIIDDVPLEGAETAPAEACEHRKHLPRHPGDEPAVWLVWWRCPGCKRVATLRLCDPGKQRMRRAATVGCVLPSCGFTAPWDDFVLTIRRLTGGNL